MSRYVTMISLHIRKLHASTIATLTQYWIVFCIILSESNTNGSYLGTDSSCGLDYPYSKCYAEYKILRVLTPDEHSVRSVITNVLNGSLELDVLSEPYSTKDGIDNLTGFDVMVSPSQINKLYGVLERSGLNKTILHHDVKKLLIREANMVFQNRHKERFKRAETHRMTWKSFHAQEDMDSFLDYLEGKYKGHVSVETIGVSHENRKIRVVKVCKGREGCGKKPAIWIDGGMHAREWISPAVVTYLLKKLLDDRKNKFSNRHLVDQLDWYILPLANPDGYEWSRTEDRFWRKNRGNTPVDTCYGIDLNRNFDFHWDNAGGASAAGCAAMYRGEKPFSEPESRSIESFILRRRGQLKMFNTIHSYKQAVVLPWGIKKLTPPTSFDKIKSFVQQAADVMKEVYGNKYRVGCTPCILYEISGQSLDWAHGKAGIPYSMSIELPPRSGGESAFIVKPREIRRIGEEVWAFHKKAAEMLIEEFENN